MALLLLRFTRLVSHPQYFPLRESLPGRHLLLYLPLLIVDHDVVEEGDEWPDRVHYGAGCLMLLLPSSALPNRASRAGVLTHRANMVERIPSHRWFSR